MTDNPKTSEGAIEYNTFMGLVILANKLEVGDPNRDILLSAYVVIRSAWLKRRIKIVG